MMLDRKVERALDSLISFMCSRPCCKVADKVISPHSYCNMNRFMWTGKQFEDVKLFEDDTEHGIFHGIMTFIVASIIDEKLISNINDKINFYNEDRLRRECGDIIPSDFHDKRFKLASEALDQLSIIPGCIFHDIYRCIYDAKDHGTKLKEFLPTLHESTYNHTIPRDEQTSSLLIRSDRIELLRYDNYAEWVDQSVIFRGLSDDKINTIKMLYSKLRPALLKAYQHRHERWIRHGIESSLTSDNLCNEYPSEFIGFWDKTVLGGHEKGKKYWSVELGYGPINDCFTKKHDTLYEQIQGKLPLSEYNNKLYPCIIRDHLVATGSIPIEKWIFNYRDISNDEINLLYNSPINVCSEQVLCKFLKAATKIMDLLYALKTK